MSSTRSSKASVAGVLSSSKYPARVNEAYDDQAQERPSLIRSLIVRPPSVSCRAGGHGCGPARPRALTVEDGISRYRETDPDPARQLTVSRPARVSALAPGAVVVPGIIADAGENAARRFLEFFAATIRQDHRGAKSD
jgi:hypothetical protein